MHMADALVSPTVAALFGGISAVALARSARAVQRADDSRTTPLMGVMGAFVFAAQMVNFAIPGTGSSGHLGGGLLLAILLGPYAAFLTITSILLVQALLFADGGLLALGCNVFNLGLIPIFAAYPLLYRPLCRRLRLNDTAATVIAAVAALLMGGAAVVAQTTLSGISSLPPGPFALLMLPVHGVIGIAEGLITAAVIGFIRRHRPTAEPLPAAAPGSSPQLSLTILATALVLGGGISLLASEKPDGLEWSVSRLTEGLGAAPATSPAHDLLAKAQQWTALLPDYSLQPPATTVDHAHLQRSSSSMAGIAGGLLTLAVAGLAGFLARLRLQRN